MIAGTFTMSCKKGSSKSGSSSTTGWNLNDKKWGGFEKSPNAQQITGPNLVLVEGGTFVMGATEEDLTYENFVFLNMLNHLLFSLIKSSIYKQV